MTSIILFLLVYFCVQLNQVPKCILYTFMWQSTGKFFNELSPSKVLTHESDLGGGLYLCTTGGSQSNCSLVACTVQVAQHCTAEWWTVHLLNYLQVGFCAPLRRLGLAKVILASSSTSACKCQMQMQGDQLIRWYSNQIPLSWKQSTLKYALSWSDPRGWFYQLKNV